MVGTSSLSPLSGTPSLTVQRNPSLLNPHLPTRNCSNDRESTTDSTDSSPSIWRRLLPAAVFKEHIVADEGFNRWLVPPAAIATHLCIGSVYAWSMFNDPLTRELGVVASAATDWQIGSVVPVFSTAIVFLGLSAAVAGKWLEEVGPRLVGLVAGTMWGGGLLVAAAGLHLHTLPLIYLGYGVMGGCGLGLGYVSPVSTLLRWFPDRRGMATGMAIMGFGGGAMVGAPLIKWLLSCFATAPDYLGTTDQVKLVTEGGRRMAEHKGELVDVVVASAADVEACAMAGLQEGVYLVGTGCTGAAATFTTLGIGYGVTVLAAALAYRVPRENWKPEGWVLPNHSDTSTGAPPKNVLITSENVHIDQALRTPQFYQLWLNLFCNVSAGIGLIGMAKTIMVDVFGHTMPTIVDGAFAATYVSMVSVANMVGRLGWATISDKLGRKLTYNTFFFAGIPLYLSVPYAAELAGTSEGIAPLVMFYASTMTIMTMYGGGFATIPAYLADIFGTKYVGGIHGRLLTAWSCAGVAGPLLITTLRKLSTESALNDLITKVDPVVFQQTFGCPTTDLQLLIEANTVTIGKLLAICPPDTIDPTPLIYNTTMYGCASLLALAALSNSLMRPVHPSHHMKR